MPGQMEVVNTDMETEEYDNQQSLKAAVAEKLKSLQLNDPPKMVHRSTVLSKNKC